MKKWILLALVILAALLLFRSSSGYAIRSSTDAGTVQVFGSMGCPWCVKQLDYFKQKGIYVNFTDCNYGNCPDFVNGFPTLVIDGNITSGYTEPYGPLPSPVF